MPESMMTAEAGSSLYVSGSRSVRPASGPSPGNTPTIVPHSTPTRQYRRFDVVNATLKPCMRKSNVLMSRYQ
jgi:hypothetical protein